MRFGLFYIFMAMICKTGLSQSEFFKSSDSLNKKRIVLTTGVVSTGWMGSVVALQSVWYSKYPKSKFHTFNDANEWLQSDKIGHTYTAYQLSRFSSECYRWAGLTNRKAVLIGSLIGWGYQSSLELMDGTNAGWGFSWADVGFNTLGTVFYSSQQLVWKDQKFLLKFSTHLTPYSKIRPSVLGNTVLERLLKDYNGQTYWLSFSPYQFKWKSFPEWLCVSFGYSIDSKLVGDENEYLDPVSGVNYSASREWIFSLDIDFSKLPVRKHWAKVLVKQLNYIKVPFPCFIYSNQGFRMHPFYF